ncbi:MAG: class I SAM-dependent methyltransferase [Patescibacteria group bacterium]
MVNCLDFNQYNRDAYVARIAKTVPRGARVLDVGVGTGRYSKLFEHCQYQTQDFKRYQGDEESFLREDWHYAKIDYVSDITAIPVSDQSFDFVLCTEVLEHVPEPIKAIKEIARILKKGGKILITAPLGSGLHQKPYHFYGGFTPFFYRKFLPESGLKIIKIKPNGGFLKHFVQESGRVYDWLIKSAGYKKFDPRRWLIRFVFRFFIPRFLYSKDEKYFLEDFTVGFFVLAEKES